jgi:hypothetical protein
MLVGMPGEAAKRRWLMAAAATVLPYDAAVLGLAQRIPAAAAARPARSTSKWGLTAWLQSSIHASRLSV